MIRVIKEDIDYNSEPEIYKWLDYAEDKIGSQLPDDLYMDDIKWGTDRMEIPIFRYSKTFNPHGDKCVDSFYFRFCDEEDEDIYGSKQEQIDKAIEDFIDRIK